MTKMTMLSVIVASLILGTMSIGTAYAEDTALQINMDIDTGQGLIIIAIGVVGAVVTAYEGMQKSGERFNKGKFFIAVKRTAKISVPAAFTMMFIFPDPSFSSYIMIGLVIILGAKIQHTGPIKQAGLFVKEEPVQVKPEITTSSNESNTVTISVTKNQHIVIPKLGPTGAKYQTNFVKGDAGNMLTYGTEFLWIKRTNVRSYVTAVLRDVKGNVIQIEQSSLDDADGNIQTIRLEMFTGDGKPLPRGKYTVQTQGDEGSSDATGHTDEFFIV